MFIKLRLLNPNLQVCIHCKAAEAVQPSLYCQPCLDALGQEWMKNYELGLLHSTLPAFFEATGEYVSELNYQEAVYRLAQQILQRRVAMSESEVEA